MRSAEFDREEVLRAVMTVLIEKGYAKTRMQDLKIATGLHPGSIYSAFENKRGLYIATLEQYYQDRLALIEDLFINSSTLLEGFHRYMDHILEDYEHVQERDCLFQKSLTEISHQDGEIEQLLKGMIKMLRDQFSEKLQQMMDRGEIEPNRDAKVMSQFLFMGIFGMRTMSYTDPTPGALKSLRDELVYYIEGS